VGLGKTVEAGLVAQELVLRHRARRIVIVCPADLTAKWQREMAEKFGMGFQIVDSDALKELRRSHGVRANPWRVWPRTIISLPWLRGDRAQRLLREVLPPGGVPEYPRTFGLLIVDEAHHCAPAGKGKYAVDSQQTKAVRLLAPHFEHRLFLSATPHNGYHNSFEALLELLNPQRFARGVRPRQDLLDEVMVRRVKADIANPDGTPRFAGRQPEALEVDYPDDERAAHRLLATYTAVRHHRIRGAAAHQATDMIALLLKKRLFSSAPAFAVTLAVHEDTLARRAAAAEWDEADELPPWLVEARLRAEEDRTDEDREEAEQDLLGQAARLQQKPSAEELAVLAQLRQWAGTHANRPDAKAERLICWLEKTCRPDGRWNDERVVIFTEYRDTQKALKTWLDARGLDGARLRLLHGGMDDALRERIKDAFQAPPDRDPVRILLGTDSASEGIDLQLHCHRVVNYDIPFNPNRLEQRIGRLDRYGQTQTVQVKHFVGAGWEHAAAGSYERDLEFLSRVATKVATIREDLGKVNACCRSTTCRCGTRTCWPPTAGCSRTGGGTGGGAAAGGRALHLGSPALSPARGGEGPHGHGGCRAMGNWVKSSASPLLQRRCPRLRANAGCNLRPPRRTAAAPTPLTREESVRHFQRRSPRDSASGRLRRRRARPAC
jgi:superfamily II DNA or RNA helicase